MTRYSVDVDALVGREPFAWVSHSLVNHVRCSSLSLWTYVPIPLLVSSILVPQTHSSIPSFHISYAPTLLIPTTKKKS
ncbi:hypothetical protein COCCADRAFT_93968 [Bipolaris zeicola 26-R-13]|uniref:Uncharacterized protein n=1 Tax=Cochliobolus carbonum (strain 26-R-13) TaxID=930089 RepID=W6Y8E3_COCC2|nr:uncharacterized protein COCCADRAFT_93968 [Bipolaris zeicola 26-R-13]EUC34198.1 hypothetical protein COCCADRAFT_93968 [Bipolaris zeicola 26-R-13]